MILPFIIVFIASFFLGTFGLGFKYNKPLAWEAFWLIHAVVGMVLIPTIWGLLAIPDLFQTIAAAPQDAIIKGVIFGFIWGIGGVLFGMSIQYVGVSLTYGVVMGTTGAIGGLVPLMQMENASAQAGFPYVIAGVVIMFAGVMITSVAGIQREKLIAESGKEIQGIKKGKDFWKGIVIVISSGVLSSAINIGFANALPVAKTAESVGVSPIHSSIATWIVVLWGGIAFNSLYSVILLTKNRTWKTYLNPKSFNAYKWGVLSAVLWFGSLSIYGIGALKMGELGPVIGWPMLLGLSLIFSNFWAIRSGEWEGAKKPMKILFLGVAVLIVATLIMAYANSL